MINTPVFLGYQAQVEALRGEKAAVVRERIDALVARDLAVRKQEVAEGVSAKLAVNVATLHTNANADTQKIRGLEVFVEALSKAA